MFKRVAFIICLLGFAFGLAGHILVTINKINPFSAQLTRIAKVCGSRAMLRLDYQPLFGEGRPDTRKRRKSSLRNASFCAK